MKISERDDMKPEQVGKTKVALRKGNPLTGSLFRSKDRLYDTKVTKNKIETEMATDGEMHAGHRNGFHFERAEKWAWIHIVKLYIFK